MIITVVTVTIIIILLSLSLLLLALYSSLMKYRTIATSFHFWTVTQNFILKTKKKKERKKKKNVWRRSDFHCMAVTSKVTIWELFHFPSDCFVNYNLIMIFLKVVAALTDEEAASYLHFLYWVNWEVVSLKIILPLVTSGAEDTIAVSSALNSISGAGSKS